MTGEQWKLKRDKLIKDDRIDDPNDPVFKLTKTRKENYDPPEITGKTKTNPKRVKNFTPGGTTKTKTKGVRNLR